MVEFTADRPHGGTMMLKSEAIKDYLKVALMCSVAGLPVVPLFGTRNGACRCLDPECPLSGRHPRTEHGIEDATTDQDIIGDWWRKKPNAPVGVVVGTRVVAVVATGLLGKVRRTELRLAQPDLNKPTVSMYDPHVGRIEFFRIDASQILPRHAVTEGVTVVSDGEVLRMPSVFLGPDAAGRRFIKGLAPGDVEIAMAPSCLFDPNGVTIERSVEWHEMVKSCWTKIPPAPYEGLRSIPLGDALVSVTSEIADELRERAGRIRQRAASTVANIIAIGQELIEAKKLVKHGVFEMWRDKEVGISAKTAQRAMSVARLVEGKNVRLSLFCLDALYALAAPNTPAHVRDDVLARCASGDYLPNKAVKALIAAEKRAAGKAKDVKRCAPEERPNALTGSKARLTVSEERSSTQDQKPCEESGEKIIPPSRPEASGEIPSSECPDIPPYLDRCPLSAEDEASYEALVAAWKATDLHRLAANANTLVRERFMSTISTWLRPGGLK